ncbi:MAG TPA: AbrB/MazE/SpoVT family DNA-binding domain-containing protein [Candidatus Nanoarchaeia archaeon]|nr:AbrB/MazE/SpoVT family DNA-binding domain-containing protein [Candidatus Nanoarchaeia archaeon]
MKRKIIKQAGKAFTITLPVEWIRQNDLSEKSEIDLEIRDKSLVITSGRRVAGEKVKIDVNEASRRNIARIINALYARGVDEIEMLSAKDISSVLSQLLNQNLGYALVKQSGNSFVIRDIGGGSYQDLDEIFKRVFQIIILFYESAINDIFGKEKETLESLRAREVEVNKFCLLLQRAINKLSYPDTTKGRALFTYSFALEKISDEIHRLWRTNIENRNKVKKSAKLKELALLSSEALGKSFDFYYQFNPERVKEIYEIRTEAMEKAISFIRLDSYTAMFIRHIIKIAEDSADLSHLALMMKLQ